MSKGDHRCLDLPTGQLWISLDTPTVYTSRHLSTPLNIYKGWPMVNQRLAETAILKSEAETKKCSDLIEKHICDRQSQNLRL